MDIPQNCTEWENMMAVDTNGAMILGHIESEERLDGEVSRAFFAAVSEKGSPESSQQAWEFSKDVVRGNFDELALKLNEIPEDLFQRVLRVDLISRLRYRVPKYLRKRGIFPDRLESMSESELRNSIELGDEDPVNLGNEIGIVWVSDREETQGIERGELIERLGLSDSSENNLYYFFVYDKKSIEGALHVPSSLDAINQPAFVPAGAGAFTGKTALLSGQSEGLCEAVHRGCEIYGYEASLRNIK